MEQIVIIKADGTQIPLFSRKNASCVSKAAQKTALLSEDIVSISLTSAVPLDFGIGDHILLYGKPYKLNQPPEPTKEGERRYTYDLKLEGLQYDLIDVHYHLPEDAYGETYYSDLAGHLQVLMWNINRIYPGKWVLGEYPENTEYKNITNSGKNCLQVAQELCNDYGVEFEITTDGKKHTLNFKAKVGITHAFTLKYGRGLGLYQLQRKNVNNSGVITRLYVYGGTENLGSNYGHTRLCLPGTTRLTSFIEDENAIALYGIKEGEKDYEIKPQRVGTVTALGADVITFADNTMFDLNAKTADGKSTKYLIDGTSAKIKFESGGLAGYEFDLHSYDHATNTFVINKFKDENGLEFPSETSKAFQIAVGDKYSISDIQLPDEYIDAAEEDLEEEGSKYLPTVSQPQVSYKLELTEGFFIKMWGKEIETEVLHVGDFIKVEDEQIGVNKAVRITQIERDLLKPHSYDITLSDTVTKTTTVRVWNELQDISEVIKINKLADPTKARRRWMATQELLNMVFDPEGDYYSEKIKPLSIETQMLSVGAKSTQFTLQNIMFQPNYGGDANTLYVSNGTLVHYAIDPDGLKYWTLEGATFSGLTSATAYYIYAKCPTNGSTGTIILSDTAKTVESEAGYYNFLVGVLNSVVTDADEKNPGRLVSLTYGSSTINGRFIRTGRIESSGGGTCYFDLDNDEIGGKIKFTSGSSGLGNLSEWEEVDDRISAAQEAANAAQESANNAEELAKDAKDSAENAKSEVNELNEYIDGAFADGIITEAEAKAIEKYLNTVNNTKAAIEATYNKLVANTYLSGTAKTNLVNAKVTLLGAIDNLIASINTAISDGKTTTAEKNDVDSKFAAFNTAYADFNEAVEDANKAIQDALKGYSDEAVNELNRFIDVDFNDLKESALKKDTIIEGGYIRTSLINVDDIFVKHLYGADGTFTSLSTTGEPTASKLGVHIGEEAFSQLTDATGAATLTKGTSHEVKIETVNDSGWKEFMLCSATAKEPCAVQLDWNVDVQLAGRGYGDGSYGQLVTYKKGSAQILMRYYIENVETQDYVCNTIVAAPIQPDGIGGASQNAVTLDFTPSGSFVAILQAGQTMKITAVMRALGESFGSLGGNPSAWVKMQVPTVTMTVSRSIAALCSEGLGLVKSSAERILIKPADMQTGSSGYTVRGGTWKFENEMIALNAHVSIVGSINSEQNADAAWWISAGVIIFTGESGTRFTMPLSTITNTVNHIRFVIWNTGVKITEQGTNGMFGLPDTSTAVREWTTQRPGCLYEAIYVKELGYWCLQGG